MTEVIKKKFRELSYKKFSEGILALDEGFLEAEVIPGFTIPMAAQQAGYPAEVCIKTFDVLEEVLPPDIFKEVKQLVVYFVDDREHWDYILKGNPDFDDSRKRIEHVMRETEKFLATFS